MGPVGIIPDSSLLKTTTPSIATSNAPDTTNELSTVGMKMKTDIMINAGFSFAAKYHLGGCEIKGIMLKIPSPINIAAKVKI
eukprot:CAMPEP_0194361438 /NCGR_PEP_ID=MMETSP0174-20130528/9035_1 /TAXON_ID=216777 /ORGANISM="Proboscia alata, Strain PI-D3" /LENGTH=81 /DNA_ID=CAMNT_0039133661 /DNA_START=368 /DNA_END=613 /DNA_ORIENTATION=+